CAEGLAVSLPEQLRMASPDLRINLFSTHNQPSEQPASQHVTPGQHGRLSMRTDPVETIAANARLSSYLEAHCSEHRYDAVLLASPRLAAPFPQLDALAPISCAYLDLP